MKELIIEPTRYSPRVDLDPAGKISIQGRSLIEDSSTFYEPIFRWVKDSTFNALKVEIKLEYMNTSSSKQLFNLLKLIRENPSIKNVDVKWYYEEGDEDALELGKEFESETKIPFVFFQCSDASAKTPYLS